LAARSLLIALASGLGFGSVELARCPQLIAFTPARRVHSAEMSEAAPARRFVSRMKNVSLESASLDVSAHTPRAIPALASASNKPFVTQLKATIPARDANYGTSGWMRPSPNLRTDLNATARKLSAEPSPVQLAGTQPAQESLVAQSPDDSSLQPKALPSKAVQPQAKPEQSWVVLTTWEEVDFPDAGAAQNDPANGLSEGQSSDHAAQKPLGRMTVTQLIFRVLPASSVSPSPTAMPFRSGWLVIQL
jgi:hypothetical protein